MPLDANFTGAGRTLTDGNGHFLFRTIKPGPYPWRNHYNAWRPAHIHFSLFGAGILSRLVTQMYFPGDPQHPFDPIFNSIANERSRYETEVRRWVRGKEMLTRMFARPGIMRSGVSCSQTW
jgi:protocatechuate 3,4-dioxygenase beta subunit